MLGRETARRLVIDSSLPGLPPTYWWDLLERLPGIEELELYSANVTALSLARRVNKSPTVLPFLRRVLIVPSKLDLDQTLCQYKISGNHLTRRMVQLSNYSESKIAPSEVVDTEETRGM